MEDAIHAAKDEALVSLEVPMSTPRSKSSNEHIVRLLLEHGLIIDNNALSAAKCKPILGGVRISVGKNRELDLIVSQVAIQKHRKRMNYPKLSMINLNPQFHNIRTSK